MLVTVVVGLAAVLVLAVGSWFLYQLLLQNGRLLLRVETLEQQVKQLAGEPAPSEESRDGLPVGTVILEFDLPNLLGGRMTLADARGRSVLLIFFDPACRYCQGMLSDLAVLSASPRDADPLPILVTTGPIDENDRLIRAYDLRLPVLLQEDWEVGILYQVSETPAGYLIDERGVTTSPLVVGAEPLLRLATRQPDPGRFGMPPADRYASSHRSGDSIVDEHQLRTGLPVGATALDFRLRSLDNRVISLAESRGRSLLLVFSDPSCGPCRTLAPKLEQIHRQLGEPAILMVSRRDRPANLAMADELGLTFPIVLQRHWEVSRDYGILATPAAFLIDERGRVAAEVAIGVEAILTLATGAAARHRLQEVPRIS